MGMKEFVVKMRVTYEGAYMVVSANSKEDAKRIAIESPDPDISGASLMDWEVTGVDDNE